MNIGIIGYGKMGSAIFKLLANRPHKITVLTKNEEKAKDIERKVFRRLERSFKRGALREDVFLRKKEEILFPFLMGCLYHNLVKIGYPFKGG